MYLKSTGTAQTTVPKTQTRRATTKRIDAATKRIVNHLDKPEMEAILSRVDALSTKYWALRLARVTIDEQVKRGGDLHVIGWMELI